MTCIVGVVASDGVVTLGADSASSDGHRINSSKSPKLARLKVRFKVDEVGFRAEHAVLGFTTSWRMGQLLQSMSLPDVGQGEDVFEYAVRSLVPAVRACLKDGGYATVSNGVESGGTWLLGIGGRLFSVQSDYAVLERMEPYDACGSGVDYALGAMWAMHRQGPTEDAETLLREAIEAAEAHVTTVRSPVTFISTKES